MLDLEQTRSSFLPGDRVARSSTGQTGFVVTNEATDRIVVWLDKGGWHESWRMDDTEHIA
jgi:hypothetical protein